MPLLHVDVEVPARGKPRGSAVRSFLRVLVPTLGSIPAGVTPLLALKTNSILDDSQKGERFRSPFLAEAEASEQFFA